MSRGIGELTHKIIDLIETAKDFGYVGSYSFNYDAKTVKEQTIITGEYIMISLEKSCPASVDENDVPEAPEK